MLKQGQRSVVVRMHNGGASIDAIAHHISRDVEDVLRFLKTRNGYPGQIICNGSLRGKRRTAAMPVSQRQTPSLPRLKCLEDA